MSERRMEALRAMAESADPGTAAAARHAIDSHNAKILARPSTEPPLGPDLTRRGGPFPARDFGGVVWVAVRSGESEARGWVADRRRMLVRLGGERFAMVPTDVVTDDERQTVHVTADRDSLTAWESPQGG